MTPLEFVKRARHVLKTVPVEELLPAIPNSGTKAISSSIPRSMRGGCLIQRSMGWAADQWSSDDADYVADGYVAGLTDASDNHDKKAMLAILKKVERWAKNEARAAKKVQANAARSRK